MEHETVKNGFVLFWKGILSQWHPTGFTCAEVTYPTAEHWMMAEKAKLFGDPITRKKILEADSPKEAKRLGRLVHGFRLEEWQKYCFSIVVGGNLMKFSQNENAKKFLLSTGNQILVEASPVDTIWGIGLGQKDLQATNPAMWEGKNLLGQALMVVRATLNEYE